MLRIQLNGKLVTGGTVGDYVLDDDTTVLCAVGIDFDKVRKIRCLLRCGSLLREVYADPLSSLEHVVEAALFVCVRERGDSVGCVCGECFLFLPALANGGRTGDELFSSRWNVSPLR